MRNLIVYTLDSENDNESDYDYEYENKNEPNRYLSLNSAPAKNFIFFSVFSVFFVVKNFPFSVSSVWSVVKFFSD